MTDNRKLCVSEGDCRYLKRQTPKAQNQYDRYKNSRNHLAAGEIQR